MHKHFLMTQKNVNKLRFVQKSPEVRVCSKFAYSIRRGNLGTKPDKCGILLGGVKVYCFWWWLDKLTSMLFNDFESFRYEKVIRKISALRSLFYNWKLSQFMQNFRNDSFFLLVNQLSWFQSFKSVRLRVFYCTPDHYPVRVDSVQCDFMSIGFAALSIVSSDF